MLGHSKQTVARGKVLLCLCALGAFVFVLSAGATPAMSQDIGANESDETEEIYDELGQLTVETVEYSGGQFEITMRWNGDTPEQVSLTELIELDSSGSTGISIQQQRLLPRATTTVTISAEQSSGTAAVILSTESSIQNGNALVIQEGNPTDRDPVPFNLAAIAVGASALIGVGVSIALVVRKKNAEDKGVSRIA